MSRFLELILEGIDIIHEAKKDKNPSADAPLFYGKGKRGARAGLWTNKAKTMGKVSAGLLGAFGAAAGGVIGRAAGGGKLRAAKTAAGALIGGGTGGTLGYYGGRAEQARMNRMVKEGFKRAGWKPIPKSEYKKKSQKNRVFFPKEVSKKNFGH